MVVWSSKQRLKSEFCVLWESNLQKILRLTRLDSLTHSLHYSISFIILIIIILIIIVVVVIFNHYHNITYYYWLKKSSPSHSHTQLTHTLSTYLHVLHRSLVSFVHIYLTAVGRYLLHVPLVSTLSSSIIIIITIVVSIVWHMVLETIWEKEPFSFTLNLNILQILILSSNFENNCTLLFIYTLLYFPSLTSIHYIILHHILDHPITFEFTLVESSLVESSCWV